MTTDKKPIVVIDTNLIISRLLTPSSITASMVTLIIDRCNILASQATIDELLRVLKRFQNKKYIIEDDINRFIQAYMSIVEWVPIIENIEACRDENDNKFLELAVNGKAEYIITGDKDLLTLNPFREIKILPAKYFVKYVLL